MKQQNQHISLAPILSEFIFLRESFRKFAFEAEFYKIAVGKARKYIGFTELDILDALSNQSLTREGSKIFLFSTQLSEEEPLYSITKQVFSAYDAIDTMRPKRCTTKGYIRILNAMIDRLGAMLTEFNVEIEWAKVGDSLNIRKHKVVKLEPTPIKQNNKLIAKVYNPCYTYEGKVLFHAKTDIYKYEVAKEDNKEDNIGADKGA